MGHHALVMMNSPYDEDEMRTLKIVMQSQQQQQQQ